MFKLPSLSSQENEESFIFLSSDVATRKVRKLLVLIHGAPPVRAGQWSRKVIINHGLDQGSQLPFIRKGLDAGYGVVVMNTNQDLKHKVQNIYINQT